MSTYAQQTGIIGGNLPNLYIDKFIINNKVNNLQISIYKEKNRIQDRSNKQQNIYFRIFQLSKQADFNRLSNLKNVDLLELMPTKDIQILDIDFESDPSVETSQEANKLIKQTKIIKFNNKEKPINLYYLAISYFYNSDQKKIIQDNKDISSKKTKEKILTNNKINRAFIRYMIAGTNPVLYWYGDVIKARNSEYFTDERVSNRRLVKFEIIEDTRIVDLRSTTSTINVQPSNSSLSSATTEDSARTAQIILDKQNQQSTNLSSRRSLQDFIISIEKQTNESAFKAINFFAIENSDNTYTVQFSNNIKEMVYNSFVNKNLFNNQMYEFLKDEIVEKQIKLFKKFIPNNNQAINDVAVNQQDNLCNTLNEPVNFTISPQQPNNRIYSINDTINTFSDNRKFKYSVEITYENRINKKLSEEATQIRNGLKILNEYYELCLKYKKLVNNEKNEINNFYNQNIENIINNYVNSYSLINNLSQSQKNELSTNMQALLNPQSPDLNLISIFILKYNNLLRDYESLSDSGQIKIINSSTFKAQQANLVENVESTQSTKTNLIVLRKQIPETNFQSIQKIKRKIDYISNINNGSLAIENFLNRITEEKTRLFGNSSDYQSEYMISYISPQTIKIENEIYNLQDLQSQQNANGNSNYVEEELNSLVNSMKSSNKFNINKKLTATSLDYFASIYGLSFQVPPNNIEVLPARSKTSSNNFKTSNSTQINTTDRKIQKFNKIIEFNKDFNSYIPPIEVVANLPNHLIKAKQEQAKFNSYTDMFTYGLLSQIEYNENNVWKLLTKTSLLNIIDQNLKIIRVRITEHAYDYNTGLKYNISSFCERQNILFNLEIKNKQRALDLLRPI